MGRRISAGFISLTLHLVAAAALAIWSPAGGRSRAAAVRVVKAMAAFVVQPAAGESANGLNPIDRERDTAIVVELEDETLASPGFTFDVAKIAEHPALLFPFLTPGLSLDAFHLAPPRPPSDRLTDPFAPAPQARSDLAAPRPPLSLTDAALQSLVDRAWSRRDRWTAFQQIAALVERYNPDTGALPRLLRAYLDQDGLQPFVDRGFRDPRVWAQLGLAADHVRFIAFISRYAGEHPSTRTTTELLFMLDDIAQANLDALLTLQQTDLTMEMRWTRAQNAGAFKLLADIQQHFAGILERRRLATAPAIRAAYGEVRLQILEGLVRTTPNGYRVADARFLIGAVHWANGRADQALAAWRTLDDATCETYTVACREVREASVAPDVNPARIDELLATQSERWRVYAEARLRQFGYRPNVF
jgi:hypothetical protein